MAKKSKKTAVKKTSSAKGKTKAAAVKSKAAAKSKPVKATASKTVGLPVAKKSPSFASEPRVIEYKLFTEDSVRNLEDQVNYHIKKGWAPVGGVVLHGASTFTQTMVRHED